MSGRLRGFLYVQQFVHFMVIKKATHFASSGTTSISGWRSFLPQSVFKVVLQKSIIPKIRQLILYDYWYKE